MLSGLPAAGWWTALRYAIAGYHGSFILAVLLGSASNLLVSTANPLALKLLFDEGIIRKDFVRFATLSLIFVGVFGLWRLTTLWYRLYVQRLKNTILKSLCARMLQRYYRIPYDEIIRNDNGYFISRIYDEPLASALPVVDTTLAFSNAVVAASAALAVAVSISWRAAFALLLAVPVIYGVSRRFSARIKRHSKHEKEEEAKLRGVLGRAVASYKTARTFGLCERVETAATAQLGTLLDVSYARYHSSAMYQTMASVCMSCGETAVMVIAGYETMRGRMSFGGLMAFLNAFWMVTGSLKEVFQLLPELTRAAGAMERVTEFGPEAQSGAGLIKKELGPEKQVAFKELSFSYGEHRVLEGLDLELKAGEKILVVGPNGGGKSTLAHLIAGFLHPTSGQLATIPFNRVSAAILPFHFVPGTARDNLKVDGSADRQRLFQELVELLKLDTQLDCDPADLSAGQQKKLELLMCLLKDADLYVLDEPLAHLDLESKDLVMDAIFRCTAGKMLVAILHGDRRFHGRFDRIVTLQRSGPLLCSQPEPNGTAATAG